MVHDHLLEPSQIDQYRTLILPNIAALSEAQCRQLEGFVERGGGLVATFETSLYDEWGTRRKDFGLAKLFGAAFEGAVDQRMQNSYLTLEKNADGSYHPLLKGLEGVPRIINGVRRVHAKATGPMKPPLTLIPSYPDLPMEDVWARVPKTDIPMAFCRDFGKGRVVYFPMDIDRTFWEVLNNDHGLILRNAVAWVNRVSQPLEVKGPGLVDVSLWLQKASMTAHLVNLTNPMAMKGPYREIIPMGPFEVSLEVPQGRRVSAVKLLSTGAATRFRMEAGRAVVTVPTLAVHEVVAVDFACLTAAAFAATFNQMVKSSDAHLDLTFAALGDSTRRAILLRLRSGDSKRRGTGRAVSHVAARHLEASECIGRRRPDRAAPGRSDAALPAARNAPGRGVAVAGGVPGFLGGRVRSARRVPGRIRG